ncbi:NAD(P)H-dependent oxidoreductase [uncultured Chitinophaga sp.]|jgi:Putative NADPH-quinone reductase (modulator of drug activity B)|uniref:NAD(P)H-dependent oxidoreductase n=1 Tax=uncultured Chitinophaga sp. TaxID=339340 RepID=UPI00261951A5|nr:NAD(P)H-dependent oxidoreductase [uncultured Chitinophaga sp.]
MNVLIVYAHPEPQSMNGAMFRAAVNTLETAGHAVQTTDLYGMQFNPVSDRYNFTTVHNREFFKQQLEEIYATEHRGFAPHIETELRKVEWCDLMIWQFPLWWFGIPAILKGWADRVFAMGRTYGNGHFYENGVFKGKKALLSLTTGGEPEAYIKGGFNGDLAGMLRPVHRGILQFTGFTVLAPQVVYGPARIGEELRNQALAQWQLRLKDIFNEPAFAVGAY